MSDVSSMQLTTMASLTAPQRLLTLVLLPDTCSGSIYTCYMQYLRQSDLLFGQRLFALKK